MARWRTALLAPLLSLLPMLAFGYDTPTSVSLVRSQVAVKTVAKRPQLQPSASTPLDITFAHNRLSVHVQNAPLQPVLETIAQQAGLTVTVSPTFAHHPVTIDLSQVELESGLQEIVQRA